MIRTATIGVSGFGRAHTRAMAAVQEEGLARLVAAAQPPIPGTEVDIAALREAGVPVYADWQEMLAAEQPEVVTIATPVHLHFPMASAALAAGAHVLLEKPPVPSLAQHDALTAQAEAAGRLVGVDFGMLSGGTTHDLKALVASGALGAVRRATGIGLWKRLDSYYEGSPWHGRLREGDAWSLAGPVANALGHVLNQCLYFSRVGEGFARPTGVEAELYRAHPDIENEDTAAVRVTTDVGATIGFYVTFCAPEQQTPWIELEAEKASVLWDLDRALEIRWADGCTERREYGPEARFQELKMFRNFFRAVRGEEGLLCPFAATRAFTAAALGAYAAGTPIRAIGPAHIERVPDGESVATVVRGVGEDLVRVARAGQLFTEAGVAWA